LGSGQWAARTDRSMLLKGVGDGGRRGRGWGGGCLDVIARALQRTLHTMPSHITSGHQTRNPLPTRWLYAGLGTHLVEYTVEIDDDELAPG
jgi:hypothetical protein